MDGYGNFRRTDTTSTQHTTRSFMTDFSNDIHLSLPVIDAAIPPNPTPASSLHYHNSMSYSSSTAASEQSYADIPPPSSSYNAYADPYRQQNQSYQQEAPSRSSSIKQQTGDVDVVAAAARALRELRRPTNPDVPEPEARTMDPPLLRSPLFSADSIMFLNPYLLDAIGGNLPEDAWEYISIPIQGSSQSLDSVNTPEYHIIKEGLRGYAILEVLTTERNYFKELNIIHNVIRKMLTERNILSKISMAKIFVGMEELYQLHQTFLARLEEILSADQWISEESSLATIFLEFKEEMAKHYIAYINNYSAATKQLSHEENNNPEFKKFLVECQKSDEIKHGLKDLLVRPMQRMTKYPLLLREIDKKTPPTHPDSATLKTALEAMSNLAATVNNKMAEMVKLISMFQAFDVTLNCPPTLLNSNRRCLISIDAFDKANKPIHLFLCSDLLMVVSHLSKVFGKTQHKYKFLRWLDLLEMTVEEMPSEYPFVIFVILL
ncbi:hypothetical protein HDU97_002839 [Phlyctochytrium planicorne]|nr:hypothetical protein HDU97_002839 [Phlyctochytrium planicorne]